MRRRQQRNGLLHGSETAQKTKHEVVHRTAHQDYLQLHKITNILKHFVLTASKTHQETTAPTQRPINAIYAGCAIMGSFVFVHNFKDCIYG